MGLIYKLGRSRVNKTEQMNQLLVDLREDESVDQVFYLVPDNLKFEAEVSVLNHLKDQEASTAAGMIDLQVYSFTRLAWHLLSDSKIFNQTRLTQTGLSILAKKIMLDLQESDKDIFKVYKGQEQYAGFLSNLTDALMELRKSLIYPADLDQFIDDLDDESDTAKKLADLRHIYDQFIKELDGKYLDQEDLFKGLIDHFNTHDFSKTVIVIDHFENFSGQELELVEAIMQNVKDLYVSLTLDKAYPNGNPELINLFYLPGKTYHTLFKLAQENDQAIQTDIIEFENEETDIHQDLLALENYWYTTYTTIKIQEDYQVDPDHSRIQMAELLTIQDEIQYVTNRIQHLVTKEGLRYKDILVVSRNLEDYENIVGPLFKQSHIPVFFNLKSNMSHHPLVEFLTSGLGIIENNFQYEDVMRFLRSELFIPQEETTQSWRRKVDLTENVLLAYGYRGSAWTRGEDWVYKRFESSDRDNQSKADKETEKAANQVRTVLTDLFKPLQDSLTKESKPNLKAIGEIYKFVEESGAKDRLLQWRDQASQNGDIEAANNHEQAWNTFVGLLDEYVEVIGDRDWSLSEFSSIVETAFENTEFAIVPPTLDQVMITNMNHVPATKPKAVFYIGMNSSNLPISHDNNSILDDNDRQAIEELLADETTKHLPPSTTENLVTEPFNAYVTFSLPKEYAYFSYAIKQDNVSSDSKDESLSPYLDQVKKALAVPLYSQEKIDQIIQSNQLADLDLMVGSPNQLANLVLQAQRLKKDFNQQVNPVFYNLEDLVRENDQINSDFIFDSLNFKNIPVQLTEQLAKELYGTNLYLSVSSLETFYKDPYSYFLKYGLKLKERKVLELTPAESGSFYHDVFDQVFNLAFNKDLDIAKLSDEELVSLTEDVVNQLIEDPNYRILSTTEQMKYVGQLLHKTALKKLRTTVKQLGSSEMQPKMTEVNFGFSNKENSLPGMEFPIDDESKLTVRGKIDRIDLMPSKDEGTYYLQVVDYKSSEHKVKYDELNAGLALQLMTYFDIAIEYGNQLPFINLDGSLLDVQELKPLAALYSLIKEADFDAYNVNNKNIFDTVHKKLKYKGLIIDHDSILRKLDIEKDEDNSGHSIYYPIKLLKSGEVRPANNNPPFIESEDLSRMLKYNRELIDQAGKEILSGKLDMRPYHHDQVKYIDTVSGEYQAISMFDITLKENKYRYLKDLSQEEFLDKLKEKYGEEKGENDE